MPSDTGAASQINPSRLVRRPTPSHANGQRATSSSDFDSTRELLTMTHLLSTAFSEFSSAVRKQLRRLDTTWDSGAGGHEWVQRRDCEWGGRCSERGPLPS